MDSREKLEAMVVNISIDLYGEKDRGTSWVERVKNESDEALINTIYLNQFQLVRDRDLLRKITEAVTAGGWTEQMGG